MKIAVLGVDDQVLRLVRAIADSDEHRVVSVCDAATHAVEVRRLAPHADFDDGWESLLLGSVADAVIVGRTGSDAEREDRLRKLIQEGVTVLASHPIDDSVLTYFELEMLREEHGGILRANLPLRRIPAIAQLAEMIRDGADSPVGRTEQITIERSIEDRSPERIRQQFATDIDILRALVGEVERVGALGGARDDSAYQHLAVQLNGPSGIPARWTVVQPREADLRLTLVGATGTAVLALSDDESLWQLTISGDGTPPVETSGGWNYPAASLEALTDEIAGESSPPDWKDAARSVDLTEAVQRSIVRGRTIERSGSEGTEASTFKGVMASVGCGVIFLGIGILLLAAFSEFVARLIGLKGVADVIGSAMPALLLLLLGSFLVIQLLRYLIPSDDDSN